jgi:hypothetical protein
MIQVADEKDDNAMVSLSSILLNVMTPRLVC